MKNVALFQLGALSLAFFFLTAAQAPARAQAVTESAPPRSTSVDDPKQTEWLRAYLEAREQLHATQLAIANSRVEAATEKMDALRKAMELERERQQAEIRRAAAESERRHAEAEQSQRTMVWAAASFGLAGLLALLFTPFLQARALRSAFQAAASHQLATPGRTEVMPSETAADRSVTSATERLDSVLGRVERRIRDLEQTAAPLAPAITAAAVPAPAVPPMPVTVTSAPPNGYVNGTESVRRASADRASADRAAWIAVLMNKGQSLTTANKPQEAIACYEEILRLDPKHAEAMVKKGAALERLNRFEEALLCYDEAIDADEGMTLAYLSKGGMCNRLGRHDEAIKSYERALRLEQKAS